MQKILERLIFGFIVLSWLSHLVQVFTPEVGFDAVWYHLPVIKEILIQQKLVFLPQLYQSVNPLLSDLIFGVGFVLGGELGVKVVAYFFGLGLVILTYFISRKFLDNFWSLMVLSVVSLFQVVAWQSASFYVDIAKAFWELGAVFVLIKWQKNQHWKWLGGAGLLFGASLATKLFSIFLFPVFLYLVLIWGQRAKVKNCLVFLTSSIIPPLPFYIFAYLKTGQLFFSFHQHLIKLGEIGGRSSLVSYAVERTLALPLLPWEVIRARDYTSFLLILFLPVIFIFSKKLFIDRILRGIVGLIIFQVLLWWYLPPLSTRYALSGFVLWAFLSIWSVSLLTALKKQFYWPILCSICLAVAINFAPRLMVNIRSWRYLSAQQNKSQYLEQFLDGNIDQHLKNWHQF